MPQQCEYWISEILVNSCFTHCIFHPRKSSLYTWCIHKICDTVWAPLWPSTHVEMFSLRVQVEIKDTLKRARGSFTSKFLHCFAMLRSRQHHCEIWLVYTWKIWDLNFSCWHSSFSSPGVKRGAKRHVLNLQLNSSSEYASGAFLVVT